MGGYSSLKEGSLFHLFSVSCPIAGMTQNNLRYCRIYKPVCVLGYSFWLESGLLLVLCRCQDLPKAELSQQTLSFQKMC